MSKVIVFGSLNMDLSIMSSRFPKTGETLEGEEFIINPGGKGANQAVAAARLGAEVHMIGAVGEDSFGKQLITSLEDSGVHCKSIQTINSTASGIAVILRTRENNRIILNPGSNHDLDHEKVLSDLERLGRSDDIFLTQLECPEELVLKALKIAHKIGMTNIINIAPVKDLPEEIWKYIDYICVNESECKSLTGIYPSTFREASQASEIFYSKNIDKVIITMGDKGVFGRELKKHYFLPAFPTTEVDTTAAGDTFIGAMATAISKRNTFEKVLTFAAKAAAIAVSRKGAQQSIPDLEEIERYERRL